MLGLFVQGFRIGARVFANEAQEIEIFFGSLFDELFKHVGLGVGTEYQADFFVPGGVDLIQFASAGVNELFENAPLLLHTGDLERGAFERIENAQEMLAFTKNDLRSAGDAALVFILVLYQIGTSHYLPLQPGLLPALTN